MGDGVPVSWTVLGMADVDRVPRWAASWGMAGDGGGWVWVCPMGVADASDGLKLPNWDELGGAG